MGQPSNIDIFSPSQIPFEDEKISYNFILYSKHKESTKAQGYNQKLKHKQN